MKQDSLKAKNHGNELLASELGFYADALYQELEQDFEDYLNELQELAIAEAIADNFED